MILEIDALMPKMVSLTQNMRKQILSDGHIEFKMAASYHSDMDRYLASLYKTSCELYLGQVSHVYPKAHKSAKTWLLVTVKKLISTENLTQDTFSS